MIVLPEAEDLTISAFVWTKHRNPDRQTDGRTDGGTDSPCYYRLVWVLQRSPL